MELIIPVVIVLAVVAFMLGRARDASLARRIGREVADSTQAPSDEPVEPVELLERLHRLYEAGALTEAEYEAQKPES